MFCWVSGSADNWVTLGVSHFTQRLHGSTPPWNLLHEVFEFHGHMSNVHMSREATRKWVASKGQSPHMLWKPGPLILNIVLLSRRTNETEPQFGIWFISGEVYFSIYICFKPVQSHYFGFSLACERKSFMLVWFPETHTHTHVCTHVHICIFLFQHCLDTYSISSSLKWYHAHF